MIIDISNYRWRSPAFHAWVHEHGVDMNEVLRIDVNEYTQTMTVHEFVRSAQGYPLTDYSTMGAAEKIRGDQADKSDTELTTPPGIVFV